MKYLVFIALFIANLSYSQFFEQEQNFEDFTYSVNTVYPPFSISKEKLHSSETLSDLNLTYRQSWVEKYLSVKITTIVNGQKQTISGKEHQLSSEQKQLIKSADPGEDIEVYIDYIPANNLKSNPARNIEFTLKVNPDKDASFPGGSEGLMSYLEQHAMTSIPDSIFVGFKLAAIKFSIDELGNVVEPHVFWSSEDETIDKIMMNSICDMPKWSPAEYSNGRKVTQELSFAVGNMGSCVVPLLNHRTNK